MWTLFWTRLGIPSERETSRKFLKCPTTSPRGRRPKWVEMVAPQTDHAEGIDIVCSAGKPAAVIQIQLYYG